MDASFYYNVGVVYMDTYLEFTPVEVLLTWATAMLRHAVSLAQAEGMHTHTHVHTHTHTHTHVRIC